MAVDVPALNCGRFREGKADESVSNLWTNIELIVYET
jgi:hypothetical protein